MKRRVGSPSGPRRLGQRQRPIGRRAFDEQIDRRAGGRGDLDDDAIVLAAGLAVHGENRKRVAAVGAERDALRHALLRLFQRRLLGAVAGQRQVERRLRPARTDCRRSHS